MRFRARPVWIGQISRDIGVKFTLKTWNLTTHKIDANLDDSRDYILADLVAADRVKHYGFVGGVGRAARSSPRENLTGDHYFTDGMRVVIELSETHTEPEPFDWKFPL